MIYMYILVYFSILLLVLIMNYYPVTSGKKNIVKENSNQVLTSEVVMTLMIENFSNQIMPRNSSV